MSASPFQYIILENVNTFKISQNVFIIVGCGYSDRLVRAVLVKESAKQKQAERVLMQSENTPYFAMYNVHVFAQIF